MFSLQVAKADVDFLELGGGLTLHLCILPHKAHKVKIHVGGGNKTKECECYARLFYHVAQAPKEPRLIRFTLWHGYLR